MTKLTNGRLPIDDDLWLSVSGLAAEVGISKQAVSAILRKWPTIRTRKNGRELLVNVGDFTEIRKTHTDPNKQRGAQTKSEISSTDSSYTREAARRMAYQAELARLDLLQRKRELVYLHDVTESAKKCAQVAVSAIDRATSTVQAEDLVAAVNGTGLSGARVFLRKLNDYLRNAVADALEAAGHEESKTLVNQEPGPEPPGDDGRE